MREYDKRGLYYEECENCHKIHGLLSQQNDDPEYYTKVFIICDCEELVEFKLPVN